MTWMDVAHCALPESNGRIMTAELLHWDGRLDNVRELQAVLSTRTHDDTSVTALVLAIYERWGTEGLGRLIGDWSLVIRDPRREVVVLASDYAGVRPLFYTRQMNRIFWSSRLDALVDATGHDDIDEQYIGGFLAFGGHPTHTPYTGIASVPPGQAVSISSTGSSTSAFWRMPVSDVLRYSDERRYDEQLRALFADAVATRLQVKAPVIAELSGGLDSSSVVCMAHQLITRGEVPATGLKTVSYVHEGSLDYPYIREVETFCRIEGLHLSTHHNPLVVARSVGTAAPQVWGPLHTAAAAEARRIGASTFLTGQNGDLAMGNWFDDSLQVAAPLRTGHLGRALRDALAWSKVVRVPIAWILSRAVRASLPIGSASGDLYTRDGIASSHCLESSLRPGFMRRIDLNDPYDFFSDDWKHAAPERRKHFFSLTLMRELRTLQLLEPVRGLDYTHPFAHRPLVEFVMSVPPDVLCRPGQPRRLMRRALGELWPLKLRARRSKGLFGAPWVEALRPLALNLLKTPDWDVVSRGWVDRTSLVSRLERLARGLDCNEPQLRQIILLEYWLRNRREPAKNPVTLRIA